MSTRRTRTPEEIEKSVAIAKQVMERQKKQDGMNAVIYGKSYVFVAAAYYLIHALIMFYYKSTADVYVFSGLTGLFILLGFVYSKNPFVISIVAFSIFILIILMLAVINPFTLFGGILFFSMKVIVIIGLIASIKNAIKYKRELELKDKKEKPSDILDEGFIDFN